jgi:hypothetical protein
MRATESARHRPPRGWISSPLFAVIFAAALFIPWQPVCAQVSPSEVRNPQLRELEQTYFPQLKALNQSITSEKFSFPFVLSRYVGLDPAQQEGSDRRGLEFVLFHSRQVLKITGNYNAAYSAAQLTQNQRASRVFAEVILPILTKVTEEIPEDVACDAIGFEISYHARSAAKGFDYEGKEILVVVFDRPDAFGFLKTPEGKARQEILNRSEIYLNGKDFGLAPGARDALDPEELQRSSTEQPVSPSLSAGRSAGVNSRLAMVNPRLLPKNPAPGTLRGPGLTDGSNLPSGTESGGGSPPPPPAATAAVVEQLQTKYQKQLDALAQAGQAKFHFVDYAPPSFVLFQNRVVLQITLRNAMHFEPGTSSIYKRAAQTFDLFLAPQLKDILDKIPAEAEFDGLDVSVLNAVKSSTPSSSEAIEFVCPLKALRQFTEAEITNQALIDQSVVLVNGVRIALNLQLVE